MTRLLRWWLAATAIALTGMAVWTFAPVLVFVALLTLCLGGLAGVMIHLAHRLQAWRERR
jgi:hypothetical protein